MAEKLIAREQSRQIPLTPRQVTAVIRMLVSTMGWHLLTEQCGLSTDEAAAASAWATRHWRVGRRLPLAGQSDSNS